LLPVGNGQAACGLRAVFAGAAGVELGIAPEDADAFLAELLLGALLPDAPFLAAFLPLADAFLAAFLAPPDFLAPDFLALDLLAPDFLAAFLAPDFFADFLAPERLAAFFAPDFLAAFLADFLAPVFLALDRLAPVFFAPVDFLALFLAPIDFFAPVDFFADDFLAAFFAVAITFLLDQVDMEPPAFDASSAGGYSSSVDCPGGAPRSDESGCRPAALVVAALVLRILISHQPGGQSCRAPSTPTTAHHQSGSR
jgi:hypothetical protein